MATLSDTFVPPLVSTDLSSTPSPSSSVPFVGPIDTNDFTATSSSPTPSNFSGGRNNNALMSSPLYIYTFAIALGILILLAFTIFLRAYLIRQRLRATGGRRRSDELWWLEDEELDNVALPVFGMRRVRHVGKKPVLTEVWISEKEKDAGAEWDKLVPIAASFPAPGEVNDDEGRTEVYRLPNIARRSRTTARAPNRQSNSQSQRPRSRSTPRTYSMPHSSSLYLPSSGTLPAEQQQQGFLAQVLMPNPLPTSPSQSTPSLPSVTGIRRRSTSLIANVRERERRESLPSSAASAIGVRERRISLPTRERTLSNPLTAVPPVPNIPPQYLSSPSTPASANPSSPALPLRPAALPRAQSTSRLAPPLLTPLSTPPLSPSIRYELRTTAKALDVEVLIRMPSRFISSPYNLDGGLDAVGELAIGRYTTDANGVTWEEEVAVKQEGKQEPDKEVGPAEENSQQGVRRRFGFARPAARTNV